MRVLRHYLRDHFIGVVPVVPFIIKRQQYFRSLHTAAPPAELAPYAETLHRDGIVVIPDLLPPETVDRMRAAVPAADAFARSPEGDRALMYHDAHRIPGLEPFFTNTTVAAIVRSHISAQATPLRRTIGLKVEAGAFPTFETNFHMDTWKHRIKAFFYLDDVSPENAPMVYLRGSHQGLWRRWTEQRIHRYYRTGAGGFADGGPDYYFLGSFWPHEVRQLKTDYGFEEISCTGRAGTVVIFDGRGLHRATPLQQGHRLMLTSYWIHPGHHT